MARLKDIVPAYIRDHWRDVAPIPGPVGQNVSGPARGPNAASQICGKFQFLK